MATDPLWIDNSGGSPAYSGAELRLNGVVPFIAGVGASLGVRSGVRPSGSGTDLQVAAQASPNMTVRVFAGAIIVQGAITASQGAYAWSLDATTNVTISAAHATLARTDLIVVRVRDANVDTSGGRDASVVAITGTAGGGTPSLPTDASYFTLAQIAVGAAVSTIVGGNISDKRQYSAAAGGVILCDSTTQPSAASVAPHQLTFRSDIPAFQGVFSGAWRQVTPYRQSVILGSTTASVTFSGVPNSIKNLSIRYTARGDTAAEAVILALRLNADSGANYFGNLTQVQNGTATAAANSGSTSQQVGTITAATAGSNQFGSGVIDMEGLGSATRRPNGQFRSHGWSTAAQSYFITGGFLYNGTGQITSYTLLLTAGSFIAGSEFYLDGWD